jgi:hypothetical protein
MTCGKDKAAGQRVAQALICKQDVAGSSPAVSTDEVRGGEGRRPSSFQRLLIADCPVGVRTTHIREEWTAEHT